MSGMRACVFGSTGFVGRYVVSTLGAAGATMRIPYRGEEMDFRHLRVAGDLGQVNPVELDPYDYESIKSAMEHCNVVVNCTGKHYETRNWSFDAVHCALPEAIAMAASEMGIERMVHMSALGADEASESAFLSSKAKGEKAVLAAYPQATILRPGPIVGTEDRFFNLMKQITTGKLSTMGAFPLIDGENVQQQPVAVQDVADAAHVALTLGESAEATKAMGNTYEITGDTVYSTEQLAELFFDSTRTMGLDRQIASVPWQAMKLITDTKGLRFPFLNPDPPISTDAVQRLLCMNMVKSAHSMGLEELGIAATPIEESVDFLKAYWQGGQRGSGFLEV